MTPSESVVCKSLYKFVYKEYGKLNTGSVSASASAFKAEEAFRGGATCSLPSVICNDNPCVSRLQCSCNP